MSKSNIKHFLNQLKTGNVNDIKYRKSLIATFINAVYVYDDKVIIFFNNQENSKEITFDMVEEINGVLMKESSLRKRYYTQTYISIWGFALLINL